MPQIRDYYLHFALQPLSAEELEHAQPRTAGDMVHTIFHKLMVTQSSLCLTVTFSGGGTIHSNLVIDVCSYRIPDKLAMQGTISPKLNN